MSTNWEPRKARQVRRSLEDMLDRRIGQGELAGWLGYSRTSLQGWEGGRNVPDPAVQFLYHKLAQDPGFITEIRLWSGSIYAPGEQQTSKAKAG